MLINGFYKIESDQLNVTLLNKNPGKKTWRAIAFFSNPKAALKYLVEHEIRGTGMTDLQTIVKKIDELDKVINTLKNLPERLPYSPRKRGKKLTELVSSGVN